MAEVKKCNSYKICFWVRNNNDELSDNDNDIETETFRYQHIC